MTVSCKRVWDEIEKVKKQGVKTKELEDAFCDFECGWNEHMEEHHKG